MSEKIIVFDSGTLISLAMNGLLPELKALSGIFNGKFIITQEVKREIIDRPLNIKKFELDALKLKELLDERVLEIPEAIGIKSSEISREAQNIMKYVNSMFYARGMAINLIQNGEASCLALNKILLAKGFKSAIAVDERTTRLLGEKPENLKNLMESKLHMNIQVKTKPLREFDRFVFLRSTELMYVAYKKGILKIKDENILDAVLYALKFKGAAISSEEIEEIKKL